MIETVMHNAHHRNHQPAFAASFGTSILMV
jgi:hypothetical protein